MISSHIFNLTLCGIFLISVNFGTNAAPLTGEIVDVENIFLEPNPYQDMYLDEEFGEEFNNDCADHKFKRQTGIGNKHNVEEIIPRLPISSEKVKELLRMLNKPKKSEALTLNGWSASGMPFNVLYTPNSLQQKMLSSVPERKPMLFPTSEPPRRGNYIERKDHKKENARSGMKTSTKSLQMRKHYLVIPQLFVSYGWGSLGK